MQVLKKGKGLGDVNFFSSSNLKLKAIRPVLLSRGMSSQQSSLKGKSALVTGSTSGIGLAIAKRLAKEGCNVMLNGFLEPNVTSATLVKDFQKEYGVKIAFHGADMSKPSQIKELIAETDSKLGGLDILVNNAGIQHVSTVNSFPEDRWDAIIAINLSSSFHTIKHALPLMKRNKWGRIINVASVHGLVASVNKSAYCAAKHGIVGLSKVVALENAGTGITSNCINPGWVHTPLVQKQIEAKAKEKGISVEAATEVLLAEKQPSKQFVTVSDICAAVLYFCGEGSNQITGISLPIDGGWTAQ